MSAANVRAQAEVGGVPGTTVYEWSTPD
ncbi:hypothetical protein XAB3213_300058 [Xanthomonas citri pv. bilvae]|nr:hypothetical protein XAB3213_300058 [Xanthomonas citri pv. bilvae]